MLRSCPLSGCRFLFFADKSIQTCSTIAEGVQEGGSGKGVQEGGSGKGVQEGGSGKGVRLYTIQRNLQDYFRV
jgi:hypothetical protein